MSKKIYLIRHCQSQVNKDKSVLEETYYTGNYTNLLNVNFWKSLGRVVSLPMDSELTEEGERQAVRLGNYLTDNNFLENVGAECILHSPLSRAARTCYILFGESKVPKEEEPYLSEKYLSEYVYSDMTYRAEMLKYKLLFRKEKVIILVGHSKIFQALVEQEFKIKNGSVWSVDLDENGSWSNLNEVLNS